MRLAPKRIWTEGPRLHFATKPGRARKARGGSRDGDGESATRRPGCGGMNVKKRTGGKALAIGSSVVGWSELRGMRSMDGGEERVLGTGRGLKESE